MERFRAKMALADINDFANAKATGCDGYPASLPR